MHTAGNQIVSRSLRSTLNQSGSLDLQEAFFSQELSGKNSNLTAQDQVSLDIRSSQIQETVF